MNKLKLYSGKITKKHSTDAGWDVHSAIKLTVPPKSSASISTGLKVGVPEGSVGIVKSRSGSSFKNDIEIGAGVIDFGYNGEVMVKLYNHGRQEFKIEKGDRIAQLIVLQCNTQEYTVESEIDETARGADGFGSSGVSEQVE